MNKETLIEKYLLDDLNKEEQSLLNKWVEEDPEFREELEARSILFASQRADWKKEMIEVKNQHAAKSSKAGNSFLRYLLIGFIIGALATLLWFMLKPNQPTNTNAMVKKHLEEPYVGPAIAMGPSESNIWEEAKNAYNQSDFESAIEEINKIENEENPEYKFYSALSHLYMDKPDASKAMLKLKYLTENENAFTEESHWFLALAYLKLKEDKLAKQTLNIIVENNFWKATEAKELLNTMK